MRKTLFMMAVMAITLIGFVETSSAEPFTFTGVPAADPEMSGVMTPDGMVGSTTISSNGISIFASGETESWTSVCVNFASPMTADDVNGYCMSTMGDSGNQLNSAHVCTNVGEGGTGNVNCWGVFAGGAGKYAKANGTLTWNTTDGNSSGGGNLNTE
jgi:hypothetical protein